MICRRCLRKGLTFRSRPSISSPTFVRPFSASTTENSADAGASTSPAEDPLSTPISSPGVPLSKIIAASNAKKRGLPTSIAPAGTSLAGLNYVKGKQDPIALDEAEYPEWLWQCLDVKTTAEGVGQETKGDEFCECFAFTTFPYRDCPCAGSGKNAFCTLRFLLGCICED